MLTRLKVSGFKNLVDVDIRFGPVTCIAGANGVGKSNLFDAITFLSALADRPLVDAALSVRDEGGRTADVRSLFHRAGNHQADTMSFEAEIIIPTEGWDDLGQRAEAKITFLRYGLELAYRASDGIRSLGSLEILREQLEHINIGDARENLPFPHSRGWRTSAVKGRRAGGSFISTEAEAAHRTIKLHQDGGSGRPKSYLAASLPRTVLSATNAAESPTALLARNEMRSWRLLQLEPSALRTSDLFTAPWHLAADGSHLAATLYHLAGSHDGNPNGHQPNGAQALDQDVYARVANRLADLITDVRGVEVVRDDTRELLTLHMTDRYGTSYPARALSDGTLRFLALAVLDLDPDGPGLLCLEEPENGIHPERIPAMLELLSSLAVDANLPIGPDNPLRQVIINTHSPAVVGQVRDDDLLWAVATEAASNGSRFSQVRFRWLNGTWRAKADTDMRKVVAKGDLLAYLSPFLPPDPEVNTAPASHTRERTPGRVVDRPDIQLMLWPASEPVVSEAEGD